MFWASVFTSVESDYNNSSFLRVYSGHLRCCWSNAWPHAFVAAGLPPKCFVQVAQAIPTRITNILGMGLGGGVQIKQLKQRN